MANALAWITSGVQYIMSQDFESAGTPSGWTSTGLITFHNTSSPLEGTGDLKGVGNGSTDAEYHFVSPISELWIVCLLKFVSLPSSGTSSCITLYNSSFSVAAALRVLSTGDINCINDGGNLGNMATLTTAGTLYYCKIHYKQGSGADSVSSFELSTSGTFVNSGGLYKSTTTGTSVLTVSYFDAVYSVDGECRWDHIRVSATDLGNSFSNWP